MEPVSTLVATPFDTLSMALLAQQLPSLLCFSGEQMDGDGENFSEWLERLELVAHNFLRLASLGGGPQAHVHMEGMKCWVL